jgi:hypothetical protein
MSDLGCFITLQGTCRCPRSGRGRAGDFQIPVVSARIVSGFGLETNDYLRSFPASPEGSLPLGQTRGYT